MLGLSYVRQRRARIYRYNDSILIYSNQKLRTRYRCGRASIEYNTNLIEADLRRTDELLLRSETNRPSADSTTILCEWWLTGNCWRYIWSRQVHRFTGTYTLAVYDADAILETITVLTQGKLHYGILNVD